MTKFFQFALIAGEKIPVADSQVKLTLNRPTRGRFLVYSETPIQVGGLFEFSSGYQSKSGTKWLTGRIESVVEVKQNVHRVFVRCISSAYFETIPVSLKNPTLVDVCNALSNKTGLCFAVPNSYYSKIKVPHFVSLGAAIEAIEQFGEIFSIPNFVWYLQGNHKIFVGSHADSIMNNVDIPISKDVFTTLDNMGGELPLVPGLIPGHSISKKLVNDIQITNEKMVVSWLKN